MTNTYINSEHEHSEFTSYRRKPFKKRYFPVKISKSFEKDLKYFVEKELEFYNVVTYQYTTRAKAFPQDLLNIKDREVKLLEAVAQYKVDPDVLGRTSDANTWPEHLKPFYNIMYDDSGKRKLNDLQLNILKIGYGGMGVPSLIRRNIVSEAFSYISEQAKVFQAGQKTDGLRMPLQLLQIHTLDTKRHLQIPKSLLTVSYDDELGGTAIKTPYSTKEVLLVENFDLTELSFTLGVLHAPKKGSPNQNWYFDFKDYHGKYNLQLVDPNPRKKRF